LTIVDTGELYPKVFCLVKQITGKSTKEVKAILDASDSVVIASGSYREMNFITRDLSRVGATTKIILVDDDRASVS
jgi:ribosomal protein L7/L12